ncbi:hypothetical protein EV715DRAFT_260727 [Schizophyllum commune]
MGLLSLPNELLVRSLSLVSYEDLARCAMACTRLRDLVKDTMVLQYAFLLGLNGLQDGASAEGIAARLAKLRQYLKARRRPLENSTAAVQSLPEECIEESNGNIVAYVDYDEDADDSTIHMVQLPSPLRGVEARRWTISSDSDVKAFSVESSMDLLVVVIERAGEPHPRAQKPSWTCELPDAYNPHVPIHINEDKLAMEFVHEAATSSSFIIWNWETGELYSHIAVLAEPANDPSCKKTRTAVFDVLCLKPPSNVERVVRLCLPRYKKWSRPGLLEWVSDQRPASCDQDRTRNAISTGCFMAGPCARLIGLRVPSHDCFEETPLFIISVAKLLRLTVGWEDWGSSTTRLFLHHESSYMSIRGTRYVLQRKPLARRPGFFVFDFGCDKFRVVQGDEEFERHGALVTAPTHDTSKYFDTPITTRLPYHSVVHHLDEDTWNRYDLTTVREIDDGVIVGQLDREEMSLSAPAAYVQAAAVIRGPHLPTELLVQSLSLLPHADLARLMMYAFILSLNGMQDGVGATDTTTRLKRLRQYQKDMRQLRFSATTSIPIQAAYRYTVVGDTAAYLKEGGDPNELHFVQTPSPLRGKKDTKRWTVRRFSAKIESFSIEPSLDLLAMTTRRPHNTFDIQLLAMSNGCPHPRAQKPDWTFELAYQPLKISVHILEDKIAVSAHGTISEYTFKLWNWETGEAYALPALLQEGSCCFLDSQHVAVVTRAQKRIALIDIVQVRSPTTAEHILRLRLPHFRGATKHRILRWIWNGVAVSHGHKSAQTPSTSRHFLPGPHAGIVGLQVLAGAFGDTPPTFIISTTHLVRLCKNRKPAPRQRQLLRVIDWNDWGPSMTRLFLHKQLHVARGGSALRGTRYALLQESPGPAPGYHVFDFACDKYSAILGRGEELEGQLVTRPFTHELDQLFSSAVTTSLPYYHAYRELEHDSMAPFIGILSIDDGVVLVQGQDGDQVTLTALTA